MRVIIVGGGKRSYFLARSMISKGHRVTIINTDEDECKVFARRLKAVVVSGDGTVPRVLQDAEAEDADILLALTPNDEDNLAACQIALREFHVASVFAVVNDPENEEAFHKLGVAATFSMTSMITSLIEQRAQLDDITNLAPVMDGRLSLVELRIDEDSPAIDHSLQELRLPPGSLVVSLLRDEKVIVPGGSTVLLPGDRISFVADPSSYPRVLERLAGKR